MDSVYNSLNDIKYTVDYRSCEINIRYYIINIIYNIIAFVMSVINVVIILVLLALWIFKITNVIYLLIAIAVMLLEIGISKYCRNFIIKTHKHLLEYMIFDTMSKYKNPNKLSKEKLYEITINEIAPIAGVRFVNNKE